MIYLLFGQTSTRKAYIQELALTQNANPVHLYDNDLANTEIHELVSTQTSLFGDKEFYVLHDLSRILDLKKILPDFAASENTIIFSEESVTKPIRSVFETNNAQLEDFGKEEKKKERTLPVFSLADELGRRDKKKLWLLFSELSEEVSAEEIHGILFWAVKNMVMVKDAQENPGLAPFVYTKTKAFSANYTHEELQNLALAFAHIFHRRDTYSDLNNEIEKIILSL